MELLVGAAEFAAHIGLPLNRHITLHWKAAGIQESKAASAAASRLLKRAADWVCYQGGRFAATWARENGEGKGEHVHILAHIPQSLARRFFRMFGRWLRSIRLAARHERGTVLTRRIGGTTNAAETAPERYRANLAAVVGYIIKGASGPAAEAFQLSRLEDGGTITGKRAGTTENIGRAAWRRAGWRLAGCEMVGQC